MLVIKKLDSYLDTLNIRHKVLWPSKPKEFCIVDGDENGNHYGAFVDNKLVSVASIYIDNDNARLRKFATLEEFQGKGIGSNMINHILNILKGKNATGLQPVVTLGKNATGLQPVVTRFWCDARLTAEGFYNRFGMIRKGEVFLKSGVEYIVMEKQI